MIDASVRRSFRATSRRCPHDRRHRSQPMRRYAAPGRAAAHRVRAAVRSRVPAALAFRQGHAPFDLAPPVLDHPAVTGRPHCRMACNRLVDRPLRRRQPATATPSCRRARSARPGALTLMLAASALFVGAAAMLGPWPLAPLPGGAHASSSATRRQALHLGHPPGWAWPSAAHPRAHGSQSPAAFGPWAPLALSLAVACWVAASISFLFLSGFRLRPRPRLKLGPRPLRPRRRAPALLGAPRRHGHRPHRLRLAHASRRSSTSPALPSSPSRSSTSTAWSRPTISPGRPRVFNLNGWVSLLFGACAVLEAFT